jgi:hypothetical protein
MRHVEVRQRLVAADVNCTHDHCAVGHVLQRGAIGGVLLLLVGWRGTIKK